MSSSDAATTTAAGCWSAVRFHAVRASSHDSSPGSTIRPARRSRSAARSCTRSVLMCRTPVVVPSRAAGKGARSSVRRSSGTREALPVWLTPQAHEAATRPRDTPPMDVRHFPDAQAALEVVAEPLGAAGAEGELSLGLLRRLVDRPGAFGSEVTMIAGEQDGRPIVFVLMTGDHPAQVAGFADPGEIGFGGLVAAMLDAGRRPPGVNGARHVSEPFARARGTVPGAGGGGPGGRVALRRYLHPFERRDVRPPAAPPGSSRTASAADTDL